MELTGVILPAPFVLYEVMTVLAYYGTEISPNQTETLEGYLICRNVPIARTGKQAYRAYELGLNGDPDRLVEVLRSPEEVFSPAAMASFEGKPVTDGHPPDNFGAEEFAAYAKGHVQNVRRDGDFVVADLYINDPVLASQVRGGVKREVSCGYDCRWVTDENGIRQTQIRGNHVAVVPLGRAGHEVAIKDAAQEAEKGRKHVKDYFRSLLTAFGLAAKDATQEELETMVSTTATAMDAAACTVPSGAAPAADTPPACDAQADPVPKWAQQMMDTLTALADQKAQPGGDQRTADEPDLDDVIEKLAGEESEPAAKAVTIPASDLSGGEMAPAAKDTALAILRAMRPVVAGIEDKTVRAQVADGLITACQGPDLMASIARAAQDSARKAADASGRSSYDKLCADSEAAYAARNPHKKKEE